MTLPASPRSSMQPSILAMLAHGLQGLRERILLPPDESDTLLRSSLPATTTTTTPFSKTHKGRRRNGVTETMSCNKRLCRHLRLRWSLLSRYSRIILSLCLLVLSLYIFCGLLDLLFHSYGGGISTESTVSNESSFAVVINTYKRPQMLQDAVRHYAETCGLQTAVSQIFIVWAEQDATPPDTFFPETTTSTRRQNNRSSVHVIRVEKDSLNSRFLPISGLTSKAIFMVDDDVRVDCFSLHQAFLAWKAHPHSMVGYYPRLSAFPRTRTNNNENEFIYHSWPMVFWRQKMNLILTKACFLHEQYLELYSSDQHPQQIRDYVDQYFNCEDVAMSLLVANATRSISGNRKPAAIPIYVEGSVSDKGLFNGISTGSGHMNIRSKCLSDLGQIYRDHGWGYPLEDVFDLRETTWVRHVPGFWWQFRPSNFFEWFALENILE